MRLRRYTTCIELRSNMLGHTEVESVGIGEQIDHVVFVDDFFDMVGP